MKYAQAQQTLLAVERAGAEGHIAHSVVDGYYVITHRPWWAQLSSVSQTRTWLQWVAEDRSTRATAPQEEAAA